MRKNWYDLYFLGDGGRIRWRIFKYNHGELVYVSDPSFGFYQFFVYYEDWAEEMWGH